MVIAAIFHSVSCGRTKAISVTVWKFKCTPLCILHLVCVVYANSLQSGRNGKIAAKKAYCKSLTIELYQFLIQGHDTRMVLLSVDTCLVIFSHKD